MRQPAPDSKSGDHGQLNVSRRSANTPPAGGRSTIGRCAGPRHHPRGARVGREGADRGCLPSAREVVDEARLANQAPRWRWPPTSPAGRRPPDSLRPPLPVRRPATLRAPAGTARPPTASPGRGTPPTLARLISMKRLNVCSPRTRSTSSDCAAISIASPSVSGSSSMPRFSRSSGVRWYRFCSIGSGSSYPFSMPSETGVQHPGEAQIRVARRVRAAQLGAGRLLLARVVERDPDQAGAVPPRPGEIGGRLVARAPGACRSSPTGRRAARSRARG